MRPEETSKPRIVDCATIDGIVVGFALAIANRRPCDERPANEVPLGLSNPAVLIGARALDLAADGSNISPTEHMALARHMDPHLEVLKNYLEYHEYYAEETDRAQSVDDSWAMLFCTYLKAGYIHVFAFSPWDDEGIKRGRLVDSLPIVTRCETRAQLLDRLRLAMCMFSLQRHLVRFCEHWDIALWPDELLWGEEAACDFPQDRACTPDTTGSQSTSGQHELNLNYSLDWDSVPEERLDAIRKRKMHSGGYDEWHPSNPPRADYVEAERLIKAGSSTSDDDEAASGPC